jgi:hypothetical protein
MGLDLCGAAAVAARDWDSDTVLFNREIDRFQSSAQGAKSTHFGFLLRATAFARNERHATFG